MKRFIILAAALTVALSAAAQPGSPDRGYPGAPDKQEKKLKKILGQDLYSQWRSRHPMDAPKLPDLL